MTPPYNILDLFVFRFLGQGLEALVQIDLMGNGDDGIAQHELFVGGVHADAVDGVFDAENIGQQILKFITQVIVGPFCGVCLFLQPDKIVQVIQTHHTLGQHDEHQVGDLIPVVELPYRIGDQTLFYIIADHGVGNGRLLHRSEAMGNILGGLLQIEAYIGQFLIPGQTEIPDGVSDFLLCGFFHNYITIGNYSEKSQESQ